MFELVIFSLSNLVFASLGYIAGRGQLEEKIKEKAEQAMEKVIKKKTEEMGGVKPLSPEKLREERVKDWRETYLK